MDMSAFRITYVSPQTPPKRELLRVFRGLVAAPVAAPAPSAAAAPVAAPAPAVAAAPVLAAPVAPPRIQRAKFPISSLLGAAYWAVWVLAWPSSIVILLMTGGWATSLAATAAEQPLLIGALTIFAIALFAAMAHAMTRCFLRLLGCVKVLKEWGGSNAPAP